MKFFKPSLLIKTIYGKDVAWNIHSGEKTIFLTFDDGPVPDVTPQILKILNDYKAYSTFFQVGENIVKYPELHEKVINEGHVVGNHTYNHKNGWKCSTEEYLHNTQKCDPLVPSRLFRPPFGKMKLKQIRELKKKYQIIMWSVLSYDFHQKISKEKCFDIVRSNTGSGSIVVFHDCLKAKEKVLYVLPRMLDYFKGLDYHFKTIPLH